MVSVHRHTIDIGDIWDQISLKMLFRVLPMAILFSPQVNATADRIFHSRAQYQESALEQGQYVGSMFASPIVGRSMQDLVDYRPSHGQSFGPETGNKRSYGPHGGVDFDCRVGGCAGADVATPIAGRVSEIRRIGSSANGASSQIHIVGKDWAGEVEHQLVHVDSIMVSVGDTVTAGQVVAKVSPTDSVSTGPHLDWKIRRGGQWVNPQTWAKESISKSHTPSRTPNGKALPVDFSVGDSDAMVTAIFNGALNLGVTDPYQISYILATAQHESASFRTLHEFGTGGYCGGANKYDGWAGVGLVQLTWKGNFERARQRLGFHEMTAEQFCKEAAARPDVAVTILVEGMMGGWFTGVGLPQFVGNGRKDYKGARRVVNGTDRDDHIARIAHSYEARVKQWLNEYGY